MPRTLLEPPDLSADFWTDPDLLAAVEREQLGQFLLAYRGARRARFSQDQVARWTGWNQSTISQIESEHLSATHARLDRVFQALHVPPAVATRWGQM